MVESSTRDWLPAVIDDQFLQVALASPHYSKLEKALAQEIVRLRAKPSAEGDGWIAVTERLPEVGYRVLMHTKGGEIQSGELDRDWVNGNIWYGDRDVLGTSDVSHWRPLPAPPSGQGEKR